MKQKIMYLTITAFSFALLFLPSTVNAEVEITGLKEVVDEEIQLFKDADGYSEAVEELKNMDLSNYKESDEKVNVYLFRGSSCGHCFDAVTFFASIAGEYGDYFNLRSYEVWSNTDNSDLMNKVGEKLGDEVSGVPYIVIGKKSWSGFTDSYGDEIKSEIKSQYEKDKSDRYDILTETNQKSNDSTSNDIIAIIIIILVVGGITTGIIMARKNV